MKRTILTAIVTLITLSIFIGPAFAEDTGTIEVRIPSFAVGYTRGAEDYRWKFATFEGRVKLFKLNSDNFKSEDQKVAVFQDNLNGSTNVTKADVSDKSMAVLNHVSGFYLDPGSSTSPFPSIWIKGDDRNPAEDGDVKADKPTTYLTGTDADKFYQTGLTIQSPYYDAAKYQWEVYVFANKDILTEERPPSTTPYGRILDPRLATMRWWAWTDDSFGIPPKMWKVKVKTGTDQHEVYEFNTLPLLSSTLESMVKPYLTGSYYPEESEDSLLPWPGSTLATTDEVYYGDRYNEVTVQGRTIPAKTKIGLVYVAPEKTFRRIRTENLHIQFLVLFPKERVAPSGSRSCTIYLYQRTSE